MSEFLTFRRMITPLVIQVVFWIGVAATVIGGLVMIANGKAAPGLALLVLGPLGVRIYAELLIVLFRMNENIARMANQQIAEPPATAPAPFPSG